MTLSCLHGLFVAVTDYLLNYSSSGIVSYKAQSQDEEALVRAAASMHMAFVNKNSNILGMNLSFSLYIDMIDKIEILLNTCFFVFRYRLQWFINPV